MTGKISIVGLLLFLSSVTMVVGQNNRIRQKLFPVADTIVFDSVPVVKYSLIVRSAGKILPAKDYNVESNKAILWFNQKPKDSLVEITWRIYPPQLNSTLYHKLYKETNEEQPFVFRPQNETIENIFGDSDIDKTGSISRGFTLGNNQDVSMSSSLNLQLSGKLSNNLSVVASITDSNIPVQPEGNTQQLQEFDKIFIQVYNDNVDLIFGDYILEKPTGTFLNVQKKLQGLKISNQFKVGGRENKTKVKNSFAGAVSKGKYNRQKIEPIEGNQGPYKLQGANSERFIIIVAGSEKVFVDGKELERGQQYDYTIDYNSAEIIFMPKVPINQDMRIYVEFEYSDKNYTRFLASDFIEIKKGKTKFWANFISEADAKNQPIDQDLTDEEILVLQSVGDNVNEAVISSAREQEYSEDYIMYARIDSTVGGQAYEIYYYSTNPDSAKYNVGFSYVGENKGNYIQDNGLANGRVYAWVAPVNGIPQGSYEPVALLAAPKSQQMISAGMETGLGDRGVAFLEMAYSHYDINTFSDLDASNDDGMGIDFKTDYQLYKDTLNQVSVKGNYQFVHRNFNGFERYRSTEFERDWNVQELIATEDQHLTSVLVEYERRNKARVAAGIDSYILPDLFSGMKGNAEFSFSPKYFNIQSGFSYLDAVNDSLESSFFREKGSIGVPFWKLEAGIRHEMEINKFTIDSAGLQSSSYEFQNVESYLKTLNLEGYEFEVKGVYRYDDQAYLGEMTPKKDSRGASLSADLKKNKKSTWRFVANYREVRIKNDSLVNSSIPENTVSGRVENRSVWFKGFVRSSTFYEVSTGLESKKEYAYLEVEPGQGVYVWIDRNENGVKELNEFEVALIPSEADHIRMYIPTDDYISVYSNKLKQTLKINLRKWKTNKNSILKFMSRFSDQFSFTVSRKSMDDKFKSYANPFAASLNDTMLVQSSSMLRNIFSFNKTHQKWGIDLVTSQTDNKSILSNGFEGRQLKKMELQGRWNISTHLTLLEKIGVSQKEKSSAYFSGNDYRINIGTQDVVFRIQPKVSYRFELQYVYNHKENTTGIEVAKHHDGGVSFQYSMAKKSNFRASAHYINVEYNGTDNSSLSYEMLNGLTIGDNYTWELNWSKQLSRNFQMSLVYNGRGAKDAETIHIGSMRVKAVF